MNERSIASTWEAACMSYELTAASIMLSDEIDQSESHIQLLGRKCKPLEEALV